MEIFIIGLFIFFKLYQLLYKIKQQLPPFLIYTTFNYITFYILINKKKQNPTYRFCLYVREKEQWILLVRILAFNPLYIVYTITFILSMKKDPIYLRKEK